MKNRYASVVCGGVDVHYKFSTVSRVDCNVRFRVDRNVRFPGGEESG